jgi:CubicO group peptidase (beta-lactamase class C family)
MANNMTPEELRRMCDDAAAFGMDPARLLHLDRMVTSWVEERRVTQGAAVCVVRGGKTVFTAAYGKSGVREEDGDVGTDHIFPMASITKPVVAALVCRMQEDGLLELNHRVRPHVHALSGDEESHVRIWQLMTHTSGYTDSDDTWGEDGPNFSASPENKHHTVMNYCGFGYQVLAELIKIRSGTSLDEYAQKVLFGPLGMKDTYWLVPEEKKTRVFRRGERFLDHEWCNEHILNSESGSGGLKSTAPDMGRFVNMFLNRGKLDGVRVLSKATVDMILTDYNYDIPDSVWHGETLKSTWGLGWNIRGIKTDDAGAIRSARAFNHNGHGGAIVFGDPDYDVGCAFFFAYPKDMSDWNWGMPHVNNMVLAAVAEGRGCQ